MTTTTVNKRIRMDLVTDLRVKRRLERLGREQIMLNQLSTEIERLYEFMAGGRFDTFVELGCKHGGSALMFSNFVAHGGRIILVDSRVNRRLERAACLLRGDGFDVTIIKQRTNEALASVVALVGSIDYLHIDADHRYEGVKWDFENYAPLVRQHGIIQMHDIAVYGKRCADMTFGPCRLWHELSAKYKPHMFEIIDETYTEDAAAAGGHGGIGLIVQT